MQFYTPTSIRPTGGQKKKRSDPRSDGQPAYLGHAFRGAATSDNAWEIEKFYYDGDGNFLYSELSLPNQIWDNRADVSVVYA